MASTQIFRAGMLRECWVFSGFIVASVTRAFVSRYLGTPLGFFWGVSQPPPSIALDPITFPQVTTPAIIAPRLLFVF